MEYADEQEKLAKIAKNTAKEVTEEDAEAFKANEQVTELEQQKEMENTEAGSAFQKDKATLEREHQDNENAAVSAARAELAEFKAQLAEKVHQAQLKAEQVEEQAKKAQARAVSAVEAAKQQTKLQLAEARAQAEKEESVQQSKMLEDMDSLEAETSSAVQAAQADTDEETRAAKAAEARAVQQSNAAKEAAAHLAQVQIDAIKRQAKESMAQAAALAASAKQKQIDEARTAAGKAKEVARQAQNELNDIEGRIAEAKKTIKLVHSESEGQVNLQTAHMQAAVKLKRKLKNTWYRLRHKLNLVEAHQKEILEDNDKLRAFLLVYKANAATLKSEVNQHEWSLENLKKIQSKNSNNLQAARMQAATMRKEAYQLSSALDTLERARRNVVAHAAERERLAANLKVQQKAETARATEAAIAAKEALERMDLNKLKVAAENAASARQSAFSKL